MGVAVSEDGAEQGGMGVAVGDYDGSGRFSLFKTNFAEEYNNLYHNDGDHFTDVSFRSQTAASSLPYVGWGTAFLDYDNDGLLDIIAVNGHVYPQMDQARLGASAGYRQRKLLYHNRGRRAASTRWPRSSGRCSRTSGCSRGLAVGDLDNDGRLDVVINDLDGRPQVLHNELAERGNWLLVKLRGKGRNTDAIGAVVTVQGGEAEPDAAGAERDELPVAGRHAPPLRPGGGDAGGQRRGPLAGRDDEPAGEREGESADRDSPGVRKEDRSAWVSR